MVDSTVMSRRYFTDSLKSAFKQTETITTTQHKPAEKSSYRKIISNFSKVHLHFVLCSPKFR